MSSTSLAVGAAQAKAMIDRTHRLAVTRQATLLGLSRASLYYTPRAVPTSSACSAPRRFTSAWMVKAAGGTPCSSSGSGAPSSRTGLSARLRDRLRRPGWPRALLHLLQPAASAPTRSAAEPQISCTVPRCRARRQRHPVDCQLSQPPLVRLALQRIGREPRRKHGVAAGKPAERQQEQAPKQHGHTDLRNTDRRPCAGAHGRHHL
jgi:hypothetical protein